MISQFNRKTCEREDTFGDVHVGDDNLRLSHDEHEQQQQQHLLGEEDLAGVLLAFGRLWVSNFQW